MVRLSLILSHYFFLFLSFRAFHAFQPNSGCAKETIIVRDQRRVDAHSARATSWAWVRGQRACTSAPKFRRRPTLLSYIPPLFIQYTVTPGTQNNIPLPRGQRRLRGLCNNCMKINWRNQAAHMENGRQSHAILRMQSL